VLGDAEAGPEVDWSGLSVVASLQWLDRATPPLAVMEVASGSLDHSEQRL
jgi:hypothetical protein